MKGSQDAAYLDLQTDFNTVYKFENMLGNLVNANAFFNRLLKKVALRHRSVRIVEKLIVQNSKADVKSQRSLIQYCGGCYQLYSKNVQTNSCYSIICLFF